MPVSRGLLKNGSVAFSSRLITRKSMAFAVTTDVGQMSAIYEVTGDEWFDYAEAARRISVVIGKPVTYTDVPEGVVREALMANGLDPGFIESILSYFGATKTGKIFRPTPTVAELLGRPPYSFDDWARHNAALLQ